MEKQSALPRARRMPRRLVQELTSVLTGRSVRGAFKRGDKLPGESTMMQALGASRPVIREAIPWSKAAGLVATRPGIGTFVLDICSPSGFRIAPATIITLRKVLVAPQGCISLEMESAGRVAYRCCAEQLAAMRAALDAWSESAAHARDAVTSLFQFYLRIACSHGPRHFTHSMTHLCARLTVPTGLGVACLAHDDQPHHLGRPSREHDEIYQASDAARNSLKRLRQAYKAAQG